MAEGKWDSGVNGYGIERNPVALSQPHALLNAASLLIALSGGVTLYYDLGGADEGSPSLLDPAAQAIAGARIFVLDPCANNFFKPIRADLPGVLRKLRSGEPGSLVSATTVNLADGPHEALTPTDGTKSAALAVSLKAAASVIASSKRRSKKPFFLKNRLKNKQIRVRATPSPAAGSRSRVRL